MLVGGIAFASIPGSSGTISGCYSKLNGRLRVIDADRQSCPKSQVPISWNQAGPAGATGPQGPAGPPSGTSYTAGPVATSEVHDLGDLGPWTEVATVGSMGQLQAQCVDPFAEFPVQTYWGWFQFDNTSGDTLKFFYSDPSQPDFAYIDPGTYGPQADVSHASQAAVSATSAGGIDTMTVLDPATGAVATITATADESYEPGIGEPGWCNFEASVSLTTGQPAS
jgi:hypothetical protein